jgi:hypothetical protein
LQFANEAAADEASVLIPDGARTLAECLVRLGRELTSSGPSRVLGVGGTGLRSQLAARIDRLLRGPRIWQPSSVWVRWTPHVSAIFVALATAILPIQTGLSGSILAVLVTTAPARADTPRGSILWSASNAQSNPKLLAVLGLAPTSNAVANPRPKVSLVVQTVFIPENDSNDIGLDWIFGLAPTNNPALETSHDWKALRPSPPIHGQRLVIDRLHTDGQSAILKPAQFAALRDRIVLQGDTLTSPACVTGSGLRAHIAVQNLQETVTDVEAAIDGPAVKGPSVNYVTDGIALGLAVDILTTLEEDGRWRLVVFASETAFIGYDKDFASMSAPGGKPIEYQIPHPHFRAVEADAEDSLLLGQTLAVRGPLWTETTKTKAHFFVPAKTKTVRQRLYVFVTPTRPAPSKPGE